MGGGEFPCPVLSRSRVGWSPPESVRRRGYKGFINGPCSCLHRNFSNTEPPLLSVYRLPSTTDCGVFTCLLRVPFRVPLPKLKSYSHALHRKYNPRLVTHPFSAPPPSLCKVNAPCPIRLTSSRPSSSSDGDYSVIPRY